MKTIQEIQKLVNEYKQASDINSYIDIRKRMLVQFAYLTEILSDCQESYNNAEYKRKIEEARATQSSNAKTATERKIQALIDTEEIRKEEADSKNLVDRLKNWKEYIREQLSALQQDISTMKTEQKHTNNN